MVGGIAKGSVVENPIYIEQGIAYGKHCYCGSKPLFNWNHEYMFTLYTLDCTLEAGEKSKEDISVNIDDVMRMFYLCREFGSFQFLELERSEVAEDNIHRMRGKQYGIKILCKNSSK